MPWRGISKYLKGMLLAVLWSMSAAAGVKAQTGADPAEQASVEKVITDFADAWNHHDVKAMAAFHTEDVNSINTFGQWWKGRKAMEEAMTRGHAAPFAHSTMVIHTEQVRFLRPDVAVVHGTMELLNAPAETLGRSHWVRVLVKDHGKWLISNFQNTPIREGSPTAPNQR